MKLFLPFPYLANSLALSVALLYSTSARGQITPDNTTPTDVTTSNNVTEITGGTKANSNLFHSFREFSVANGSEAFFNNTSDIDNIFSRVTGGNISNINGLIRANDVNLFLINPAGIIFGAGARLDIGGSFYGSSADSIIFPDGEFIATDAEAQPILTINAPIGLGFRDNPGEIVNKSAANDLGLQVSPGETLALIGGDVKLEEGFVTAPGGVVELGGLSEAGVIGINETGSLNFPEGIARSNVELTNNAAVDVRADGGGFINVNANNLTLSGQSELLAGIAENMGSVNAQAGDITIDATESVTIIGDDVQDGVNEPIKAEAIAETNEIRRAAGLEEISEGAGFGDINKARVEVGLTEIREAEAIDTSIRNYIGLPFNRRDNPEGDSSAVGNSGKISITTDLLKITNRGDINTRIYGRGNAADIDITANNITLDNGAIVNQVAKDGVGDSGNINLDTNSLSVANFGFIITNNFGTGNAGDINISATDSVFLGGSLFNGFISEIGEGVEGDAGDINITTGSLTIDGAEFGAQLLAVSKGRGDGGNVNINATENVTLLNKGGILSSIELDAEGNAGNITINTSSLNIKGGLTAQTSDNAIIQATSKGIGNAGNITINASENISLNDGTILSQVLEQGTGNAGTINLNSPFISLDNYSLVSNGIIGQGLGGNISITSNTFSVDNFSILASNARNNAIGTGGNIEINSNEVIITEGGVISAFTENDSNGGTIAINANNLEILSGGKIVTQTDGGGNAGNTTLNIANGIVINGSNPARSGESQPFEDNLLIELEPETGLFANTSVNSTGNGGNITIVTPNSLNLTNNAQISVDSRGMGNSGTLKIQADSLNLDNGFISAATVSGTGGLLSLDIDGNIRLRNNSKISAQAFGDADGGNIDIAVGFIIATPNQNNDIVANAQRGKGGNINIRNEGILGLKQRDLSSTTNDINASSELNLDGTVNITNPDTNLSEEVGELPENVVNPDEVVAQTCSPTKIAKRVEDILADRESSFTIKGRGFVAPPPTAPLTSDAIKIEGQNVATQSDSSEDSQSIVLIEDSEPVSIDDIVPARGIIINEKGEVILTAYPTENNQPRYPRNEVNCL